jgi:uncharacterized protein (TIGR02246 family)
MGSEDRIRAVLKTYQHALNTDDVTLAVSCYTSDGVFMPTTLPTSVGAALTEAYAQTFEAIHLDVEFTIDEIVVVSDAVAYALTRSNGIQTVRASGQQSKESNREVFILHAVEGQWKIARYMFNKPG